MNPPGRSLRLAGRVDRSFVRGLAGEVFSHLGEYARMVPEWLEGPGAGGLMALEADRRVGFAITCLAKLPGPTAVSARPRLALDLMAIAVVSDRRRQGLGAWILEAVLDEARCLAANLPLVEVTLTIEEGNVPARQLFEAHGFRRLEGTGTYPRGQTALNFTWPMSVPPTRVPPPGVEWPGPGRSH